MTRQQVAGGSDSVVEGDKDELGTEGRETEKERERDKEKERGEGERKRGWQRENERKGAEKEREEEEIKDRCDDDSYIIMCVFAL